MTKISNVPNQIPYPSVDWPIFFYEPVNTTILDIWSITYHAGPPTFYNWPSIFGHGSLKWLIWMLANYWENEYKGMYKK